MRRNGNEEEMVKILKKRLKTFNQLNSFLIAFIEKVF